MSSTRQQRWQERVPDEPPGADSATPALALERVAHYEELIRFESQILGQMVDAAGALSDEAREEVEASNMGPQRALIEEFRRRRDSWAGRLDSAGLRTDPTPTTSK